MKKLNDNDVSNWVPSAEETVLEDLECHDPFAHRKERLALLKFPGRTRNVLSVK